MYFRVPLIRVENVNGVPANYLMYLEKQLSEIASRTIGEVMVYELVQHVQVIKIKYFIFIQYLKDVSFLFFIYRISLISINLNMHHFMKKGSPESNNRSLKKLKLKNKKLN